MIVKSHNNDGNQRHVLGRTHRFLLKWNNEILVMLEVNSPSGGGGEERSTTLPSHLPNSCIKVCSLHFTPLPLGFSWLSLNEPLSLLMSRGHRGHQGNWKLDSRSSSSQWPNKISPLSTIFHGKINSWSEWIMELVGTFCFDYEDDLF